MIFVCAEEFTVDVCGEEVVIPIGSMWKYNNEESTESWYTLYTLDGTAGLLAITICDSNLHNNFMEVPE